MNPSFHSIPNWVREVIVSKGLRSFYAHQDRLLLIRKLETYFGGSYLEAVPGAPAYLGRQLRSSTPSASGFSGKVSIGCTSIVRFTLSTIPGRVSISQRAASALAAYSRACSSSALALFKCWARWSKQASSSCCSTSLGFLESSRYSKEGNAGMTFTIWPLNPMCTLLSRHHLRYGSSVLVRKYMSGALR
jgi:hypothetical protein